MYISAASNHSIKIWRIKSRKITRINKIRKSSNNGLYNSVCIIKNNSFFGITTEKNQAIFYEMKRSSSSNLEISKYWLIETVFDEEEKALPIRIFSSNYEKDNLVLITSFSTTEKESRIKILNIMSKSILGSLRVGCSSLHSISILRKENNMILEQEMKKIDLDLEDYIIFALGSKEGGLWTITHQRFRVFFSFISLAKN